MIKLKVSLVVNLVDSSTWTIGPLVTNLKIPKSFHSFVVPKTNTTGGIIISYLKGLEKNLMSVHLMKGRRILIITDDTQLFHILKYPVLTAFILYFGSNGENEVNTKFSRSLINEEIKTISVQINNLYLEIPARRFF